MVIQFNHTIAPKVGCGWKAAAPAHSPQQEAKMARLSPSACHPVMATWATAIPMCATNADQGD